ncbi:hypothetical protein [Halosolutus halophilus]|uniref:hypothetical protein n=1 Tax=Halosolutus halophilus TaxID=1552990 RepID=UPI00223500E0|nr:hypothetical protein [Halosolutus halophilus]
MSEFESEATLDILVEQQSLRAARQQVEQEFAQTPITVDVQTDTDRSAQARQTSSPDDTRTESREMAARDRARTRQLLTNQTAVLEDIAAQVETLAPEESQDPLDLAELTPDPVEEPDPAESEPPGDLALSLPSGASPEFPEQPPQRTDGGRNEGRRRRRERRQYRWDRQRTESLEAAVELLAGLEGDDGGGAGGILDELLGVGAGAGAGLLSGAIGPALGSGIGSAVGTAVGDVLSDEEVALNTEDVEEIGVDVPDDPLAVDHPKDPYAVDHPDDPYAIDHPEDPYAVDHPEGPYAVDHPGEPYALDHPDEPYAVEDPSPLEVEDVGPIEGEPLDPTGVDVAVDVTSETGTGGDRELPDDIPEIDRRENIPEQISKRADQGGDVVPGLGHLAGGAFGAIKGFGDFMPGSKARAREARTRRERRDALLEEIARGGSGGGGQTQTSVRVEAGASSSQPAEINTEVGPVDVGVQDLDRMVEEATRAFEERIQEARDDLERQIDDLERQIERSR